MANRQVFTVGYEAVELSSFLATLKLHGIKQIIDVRELPLSRRRGFSKNVLAAALGAEGIAYVHLKELGDPKPGREAARRGDFSDFRKIYRQHLRRMSSQNALGQAAALAAKTRSCLLCYEREAENCHRTIVTSKLSELWNFVVNHIAVCDTVSPHKNQVSHERDRDRAYAVG